MERDRIQHDINENRQKRVQAAQAEARSERLFGYFAWGILIFMVMTAVGAFIVSLVQKQHRSLSVASGQAQRSAKRVSVTKSSADDEEEDDSKQNAHK